MTYAEFVARVISDGEHAARREYRLGTPRLNGALSGFAACVQCDSPPALAALLAFAREKQHEQIREMHASPFPDADACVYAQEFAAVIEWLCNCVSALLLNEGYGENAAIVTPTSRGVLKCAELLGVAPLGQPLNPQWFLDSPDAGTPDCLCSFCGRPIAADEVLVLRAHQGQLEMRSCKRQECTVLFLSGQFGEPVPGRAS